MIKFEEALNDPAKVFGKPENVVNSQEFTLQQKIEILHRWEYEVREIQVAEEENMQGSSKYDVLAGVIKALIKLGAKPIHTSAPTKQGGE